MARVPSKNHALTLNDEQARAALTAAIGIIEKRGLVAQIGLAESALWSWLTNLRANLHIGEAVAMDLAQELASHATYELGYKSGLTGDGDPNVAPAPWVRGYIDGRIAARQGEHEEPGVEPHLTSLRWGRCPHHLDQDLVRVSAAMWECPECGRTYLREGLH